MRSVELATRTHLLPGSELAQIRAAALCHLGGSQQQVHQKVANTLRRRNGSALKGSLISRPPNLVGRPFIVAESVSNPYVWMMYSQLPNAGFSVQYESGFKGVLHALVAAQEQGLHPHVHLDTWLTHDEACQLISVMDQTTTLSVTAHNLEQNEAMLNQETGMQVLLQRVAALHILTESSLARLGISADSVAGRVFHVPHPAYYGSLSGSYALPLDRAVARQELGRKQQEFAVGLVGRLTDRKNVDLLIRSAELLQQKRGVNGSLHIYVSGSLNTKFAERIIRRTSSLMNVTLEPVDLDDATAGKHIAALDVAVVPYHGYLNSGWTLLAISAGLPIIASRESTASEVVPADALIGFSEGDARSLANAMIAASQRNAQVARSAALARAAEVHPDVIAPRFAKEIAARVFAK